MVEFGDQNDSQLTSAGTNAKQVRDGLVITNDMLALEPFEEAKELFEEVEAVKLALLRCRVESAEEEEFMRKSSLYAGAKDIENGILMERRCA